MFISFYNKGKFNFATTENGVLFYLFTAACLLTMATVAVFWWSKAPDCGAGWKCPWFGATRGASFPQITVELQPERTKIFIYFNCISNISTYIVCKKLGADIDVNE